jgi:Fe-S-cluster containining protein
LHGDDADGDEPGDGLLHALSRPTQMRALRVVQARNANLAERVAGDVAEILEEDGSPSALVRAVEHAHRALDEQTRRVRMLGVNPACAAGCSHCCHVHVEATEPEVLAVASYLARTLAPPELAALRARLERQVAVVEPLSDEERWTARIPCALLDGEGRCSVHPARPLRCRAFHALDAGVCREAFVGQATDGPETIPAFERVHDAVEEGFERALAARGVSVNPLRLEVALLATLRHFPTSARG